MTQATRSAAPQPTQDSGTEPAQGDPKAVGGDENPTKSTDKGAETIERDATDLGVPMLAGSSTEPTGPEDALGEGPKRGDYSTRIGPSNYLPHEVKATGEKRDDGSAVVVVEAQRPRAEDIGEVEGKKGGVDSAE